MAEKGDEKDRVIIKSDGEKTYFASDIAYHSQKFARKFDILIDIWGSDHHGYIPRLKASIEALGKDKESLKVILIQFVTLLPLGWGEAAEACLALPTSRRCGAGQTHSAQPTSSTVQCQGTAA